ncbi:hypothetical protein XENOCAPTIV_013768, partial [Xenoophorus captivus]
LSRASSVSCYLLSFSCTQLTSNITQTDSVSLVCRFGVVCPLGRHPQLPSLKINPNERKLHLIFLTLILPGSAQASAALLGSAQSWSTCTHCFCALILYQTSDFVWY